MEDFITVINSDIGEIKILIYDLHTVYYGGSQYWFPRKDHQLSGCGPVAAANITAYLSQTFPHKFYNLYPYKGVINKKNFIEHMVEIRKYVKPGMFGLTSVHQFTQNVLDFSKERNVSLVPHILDEKHTDIEDAVNFICEALIQKLPIAILVLKHPLKELEDYTWHWMTITNLRHDPTDNNYYISVSTYGEHHKINLNLLWNHKRPKDVIRLAYFN